MLIIAFYILQQVYKIKETFFIQYYKAKVIIIELISGNFLFKLLFQLFWGKYLFIYLIFIKKGYDITKNILKIKLKIICTYIESYCKIHMNFCLLDRFFYQNRVILTRCCGTSHNTGPSEIKFMGCKLHKSRLFYSVGIGQPAKPSWL